MQRYIIIILALVTAAIAYLEAETIGLPELNGSFFDFLALYIPAVFMFFSVIVLVIKTNKISKILWAVLSALVTTLSSFIWSYLPVYLYPVMNDETTGTATLLALMGLALFYVILVPILAIATYLYSVSSWPKEWRW